MLKDYPETGGAINPRYLVQVKVDQQTHLIANKLKLYKNPCILNVISVNDAGQNKSPIQGRTPVDGCW